MPTPGMCLGQCPDASDPHRNGLNRARQKEQAIHFEKEGLSGGSKHVGRSMHGIVTTTKRPLLSIPEGAT